MTTILTSFKLEEQSINVGGDEHAGQCDGANAALDGRARRLIQEGLNMLKSGSIPSGLDRLIADTNLALNTTRSSYLISR